MKNLALFITILFGSFIFANGRQTNPTPQATPNPAQEARNIIRRNERLEMMRNRETTNANQGFLQQIFLQSIQPLYRKPTKEELKSLAPNAEDVRKYAEFLKQSNTGITRLAADFGCAENTKIVVATPDCLRYTMPGAGSSFSFRINNYRIRRLADLTFTNNGFQTTGVMLHGILVNLGDVSLEQISLNTKGAKFLTDFVPTTEYEKALEIEQQLIAGIENDGFSYGSGLNAQENATYILRSIAYRGTFLRAVQSVAYNELNFDKRKDILVAFRVIRQDADGSITILWKQLESKKSPKLKRERRNRRNVRENNLVAGAK